MRPRKLLWIIFASTVLSAAGPSTSPAAVRPFSAPVTSQLHVVPGSIDPTGTTDVSAELNAWVASVPDGSVVSFPAGATYRMTEGIQIANRHNLVFDGHGATIKVDPAAAGSDQLSSPFVLGHQFGGSWVGGNSDIAIRNFNLQGNSPTPGEFVAGQEGEAGVELVGTSRVEVTGVTGTGFPGDDVFFEDVHEGWLHDSQFGSAGRNGVAIISGTAITVEQNEFDVSGYCTFDIESNDSSEGASGISFLGNTAGTWGDVFLAADGAAGSIVDGVTVVGNHVTGASLLTDITLPRRQNVEFRNNASDMAAAGPVLRFDHIDGLTILGNIQPLRSGVLATITDSTGVAYDQASPASPNVSDPTAGPANPPSRIAIVIGLAAVIGLAVLGARIAIRSRRRLRGS